MFKMYGRKLKCKVSTEAIREVKTVIEILSKYCNRNVYINRKIKSCRFIFTI